MKTPLRDKQVDALYQEAMALIDQEWLTEGVLFEDLSQSKRLAEQFACESTSALVTDEAGNAPEAAVEDPAPMVGSRG